MSNYSAKILSKSPAAYFRFGEAVGLATPWRAVDASGNTATYYRNTGSALQGVTLGQTGLVTGDTNTAVKFDGTAGVAAINASNVAYSPVLSVGGLINFTSLPTTSGATQFFCLVGIGSNTTPAAGYEGWRILLYNSAGVYHLVFQSYDIALNISHGLDFPLAANTIVAGTTYSIVGTYDGTAWRIYLSGKQIASGIDSVGPISTDGQIFFGAEAYAPGGTSYGIYRYTAATYQDWFIVNRALTAAEIADIAQPYSFQTGTLSPLGKTLGPTVVLQVSPPGYGVAPYMHQLQRSTTSGSGFANVGTASTATTFTDSTATVGSTYFWRVVTTDAQGSTATTAELTFKVWNQAQYNFMSAGGLYASMYFNAETFFEPTSFDIVAASIDVTNIFGNTNGGTTGGGAEHVFSHAAD